MTDTPPDSLIPYDEIVQDALRAVVGRVLGQVEKDGLPGGHHFYITFKTHAPGVDIPRHLINFREKDLTTLPALSTRTALSDTAPMSTPILPGCSTVTRVS